MLCTYIKEFFAGNHHRKRHGVYGDSNSINFHQMLPMRYVKIMRMYFWDSTLRLFFTHNTRMEKYLHEDAKINLHGD